MITAHTSEGQTMVLPAEYQNMTLWSKNENDIGFIDCTLYHTHLLKHNKPVYVKQCPISAEKAAALDVMIGDLLTTGVIKPTLLSILCQSLTNLAYGVSYKT